MTEFPAFAPQINEFLQILPLAFPSIASVMVKFHQFKITNVRTESLGRGYREGKTIDESTAFVPTGGLVFFDLVDQSNRMHELEVVDYRRQFEKGRPGDAMLFLDGKRSGNLTRKQNRFNHNDFEARYKQPDPEAQNDNVEDFNW